MLHITGLPSQTIARTISFEQLSFYF